MAINLQKGQRISLEKEAGRGLNPAATIALAVVRPVPKTSGSPLT